MPNRDYEKMCVEAVNAGVDPSTAMHFINTRIEVAEQALEALYESRRELINYFGLNKPKECRRNLNGSDSHFCPECTK